MHSSKIQKIVRWVVVLFFIVLTIWVVNKNEVWWGSWRKTYSFDQDSIFISRLFPSANLLYPEQESGDVFQNVTASPVYFEVKVKKDFARGKIKLKYKKPENNFAKLGLLTNSDLQTYDWRELGAEQCELSADKLFYSSWNGSVINTDLRGYHKMLTQVQPGQDLDFVFYIFDVNRHQGADEVVVKVWQDGKLLKQIDLADDGDANQSGQVSKTRKMELFMKDVQGIVEIEFVAPADIYIDKIKSAQAQIVFQDQLYLAEQTGGQRIDAYVAGDYLSLFTSHRENLQKIYVNGQGFAIKDVLKYQTVDLRDIATEYIRLQSFKGDAQLQTDGFFSFKPVKNVLEKGCSEQIVANHEWQEQDFEFDLSSDYYVSYGEFDRFVFALWMPFLNLPDVEDKFAISEISVEVYD